MRQLNGLLFNNTFLRICLKLKDDFNESDLSDVVGCSRLYAGKVLNDLERLGLVVEKMSVENRKEYLLTESFKDYQRKLKDFNKFVKSYEV